MKIVEDKVPPHTYGWKDIHTGTVVAVKSDYDGGALTRYFKTRNGAAVELISGCMHNSDIMDASGPYIVFDATLRLERK